MIPKVHAQVFSAIEWSGMFVAMVAIIIAGNTLNASPFTWAALVFGVLAFYWLLRFSLPRALPARCPECQNNCELTSTPRIVYKCIKCDYHWYTGERSGSDGGGNIGG